MKADWRRSKEPIQINPQDIAKFTPYSTDQIDDIELLEGGLSNTNYRLLLDGKIVVLRILTTKHKASVEKQIHSHLIGIVPFPKILWSDNLVIDGQDQYWYILEYVPGKPFAVLMEHLDERTKTRIYEQCGSFLSKISAFEFDSTGFFGEDFTIRQELSINSDTYVTQIKYMLNDKVRKHLDHLSGLIISIAEKHENVLDECDTTPRLCHGDYNPENIMINGKSISGILDWEFALSLSPMLDIGNFLRYENDLEVPRVRAFRRGYLDGGRQLPRNWQVIIRLYDLIALLSMLDHDHIDLPRLLDIRDRIGHYIDELR